MAGLSSNLIEVPISNGEERRGTIGRKKEGVGGIGESSAHDIIVREKKVKPVNKVRSKRGVGSFGMCGTPRSLEKGKRLL